MKATVDAASLRRAAEWAGKHTGTALPILAAVVLRADEAGLTASATDYESWAFQTVEAHIVTGGTVAVSGRLLSRVCAAMPHDGRVDLVSEGAGLRLACGAFRSKLPALPAEDHPAAPARAPASVTLPAGMGRILAAAEPVAESMESTSREFAGCELVFGERGVTVAAMDRYRGFAATVPWPDGTTGSSGASLPAPAVASLADLAEDGGALTVGLPDGPGVLTAECGGRLLLCRLSGNPTPDWRKLLAPVEPLRSVVLDAAELADLVKRLVPTIDDAEAAKSRHLTVDISAGRLRLASDTTHDDIEAAHEPVWDADPWTMAIKAPYLLSVVEVAGVDMIRIGFTGPWKAWRIERADPDSAPGTYTGTVMPIRLPS